jgi:hypothetical protein
LILTIALRSPRALERTARGGDDRDDGVGGVEFRSVTDDDAEPSDR